jgi:hypothetical protein
MNNLAIQFIEKLLDIIVVLAKKMLMVSYTILKYKNEIFINRN